MKYNTKITTIRDRYDNSHPDSAEDVGNFFKTMQNFVKLSKSELAHVLIPLRIVAVVQHAVGLLQSDVATCRSINLPQ